MRHSLAGACPRKFLDLLATLEAETPTTAPFGRLSVKLEAVSPVLAWKRKMDELAPNTEAPEKALRRARLVLYAHVVHSQTLRTLAEVRARFRRAKESARPMTREASDTIAWLNVDNIRPSSITTAIFDGVSRVIDWSGRPALLALVLFIVCRWGNFLPATFVRTWATRGIEVAACAWALPWVILIAIARLLRRRDGQWAIDDLAAKWPHGCPALVGAPEQAVKFLHACVGAGLLDPTSRSRLQSAVARAWA